MSELIKYQTEFNRCIIEFATNLSKVCPNSIIANNISYIKNIAREYPTKLVEIFIVYVLKYKDKIDQGDDDFFMNNSYSEVGNDQNTLSSIFEFKNTWKVLSIQNRNIVKQYMQYLCGIAQNYFIRMKI